MSEKKMNLIENYQKFYKNSFTKERYESYQNVFKQEVGKLYSLSTSPYFLEKSNAEKIKNTILPAIIKLLSYRQYQESIYARGWFLNKSLVKQEDFFGSADFHVDGDQIKLIELNFFIPGHFGLIELFPRLFSQKMHFKLENFAEGFEEKLAKLLQDKYHGDKVAICVNHLDRSKNYFEHYKYVEKFLNKHGVNAKVVFAKDIIYTKEKRIIHQGEEFGGILNLVIPRNWEHNQSEFLNYTNVFNVASEIFFPNPWCWTMADKRFLTVLSKCGERDYGLSREEIKILQEISLKSELLSNFQNIEELYSFFDRKKDIVLKPIDNYHTQGVFLKPDLPLVKEIFETKKDSYIAQEYFSGKEIYYKDESNKRIEPYRAQLRVEFFNAEFLNFRAYGFSDPFGLSPMMPVAIANEF